MFEFLQAEIVNEHLFLQRDSMTSPHYLGKLKYNALHEALRKSQWYRNVSGNKEETWLN